MPLVIPVRAPPQTTFDFYVSPTGDDVLGNGTLGSPWSLGKIKTTNSALAGKRVGLMGGVYQYVIANGVQTSLYSLFSTTGTGPGISAPGGSSTAPTYLASCDSTGRYSARQAIIDCADPSTGNIATVSAAPIFVNGDYTTIDGITLRNTPQGISCGGWSNLIIKNNDLYNGVCPANSFFNTSMLGFSGTLNTGSNNNLIENNYIHHCRSLAPQTITLASPPSGTITSVALASPWPYDTMSGGTTLKLSTGQTISSVTSAHNGSSLTFASTAITAGATTTATVSWGAGYPYGMEGIYFQAAGLTTPCVIRNNHVVDAQGWGGAKTNRSCLQWYNNYIECMNFCATPPAPQQETFVVAVRGMDAAPGTTAVMDHNIWVGPVELFNAGAISNAASNAGTVQISNNTFYSPATGAQATIYASVDQTNPGTILFYNNLMQRPAGVASALGLYAMGGGTSYGTFTGDHNIYCNTQFYRQNSVLRPSSGSTNLAGATWADNGTSQDVALTSQFATTPAQGNVSTFALGVGATASTAGRSGLPVGAIDGVTSVGCDFWY